MKKLLGCLLCVMLLAFGAQAHALTINDAGVVGTIWAGTQNSSVDNEIDWGTYLLNMGTNATATADGNIPPDGVDEDYETGNNDYSGTLTGGLQLDSSDVSGYEYALGKYDGQNAGYVLFNIPDLGGSSIPEYPNPIWGGPEQYQLSHATVFNSVPEPATMLLFGSGILFVGAFGRKRFKK